MYRIPGTTLGVAWVVGPGTLDWKPEVLLECLCLYVATKSTTPPDIESAFLLDRVRRIANRMNIDERASYAPPHFRLSVRVIERTEILRRPSMIA